MPDYVNWLLLHDGGCLVASMSSLPFNEDEPALWLLRGHFALLVPCLAQTLKAHYSPAVAYTVGCQSRTVLSLDPDAIRAWVGEKATE